MTKKNYGVRSTNHNPRIRITGFPRQVSNVVCPYKICGDAKNLSQDIFIDQSITFDPSHYEGRLPVSRNFYVRTHENFAHVNEIEAKNGRSRVDVKG